MDFMPCGRDFVVSADKCKLLASLWEQMSYPISPDPSGGNKKLILNKNCQGELHLFFSVRVSSISLGNALYSIAFVFSKISSPTVSAIILSLCNTDV